MTHLTIDQLVAVREPGLEPGVAGLRAHLDRCPVCQAEATRLDQRMARLKALPTLRPGRDLFATIERRASAERRMRRIRATVIAGLSIAAAITLAVSLGHQRKFDRRLERADPELAEIMARSQQLEHALSGYDADRRVVDGRTVGITTSIEDRLAGVDRALQGVDFLDAGVREQEALRLWRERVGLLDALVDIQITGARYVGF